MVTHVFNPSTWKAGHMEALWAWGQSGIQNEFQESQSYTENFFWNIKCIYETLKH